MCYDELKNKQKTIMKERKANLFLLIMEALFLLVIVAVCFRDIRGAFILPMPLILLLLSAKWIVINNRMIEQLASIEKNGALNKTYEVKLDDPRLELMRTPEIRAVPSRSPSYYGMVLEDIRRVKYYYFFEEELMHSKKSIEKLLEKLDGEVKIECFEGTNIVKTVGNDQRLIHIRYGDIC